MSNFNMACRTIVPELMDQPELDVDRHHGALVGLRRINLWSRNTAAIWSYVREVAEQVHQPLRILDIASGGGDNAIGLWQRAARTGVKLDIVGADMSPVAIAHAQRQAASVSASVRFLALNALTDEFPDKYDVVMSSLFLHHLEHTEIVGLLRKMASATNQLLLIDDLVRCRAGYLLAHVACRVLTRSEIVRVDGPRSVASAFAPGEFADLFATAGLPDVRIRRRWPYRMIASWRPG
jgi:2-polyprenyl-3-methyl-5-hydroxy-6-metoxy-1,4-benzoquinol methylase